MVDSLADAESAASSAPEWDVMEKLAPSTTALIALRANLMRPLEHASEVVAKPVTTRHLTGRGLEA